VVFGAALSSSSFFHLRFSSWKIWVDLMEDALAPTSSPFIEVRQSKIHGTGVFAATDIPSSTRIIEYVGRRVKKDDLQNLPPEARYYTHRLDDDHFVDGSALYNTARYHVDCFLLKNFSLFFAIFMY